jgi:excisionase family DNA binding protein
MQVHIEGLEDEVARLVSKALGNDDPCYSTEGAAEYLSGSRGTIRNLVSAKRLRAHRSTKGGRLRFRRCDLDRYAEGRRHDGRAHLRHLRGHRQGQVPDARPSGVSLGRAEQSTRREVVRLRVPAPHLVAPVEIRAGADRTGGRSMSHVYPRPLPKRRPGSRKQRISRAAPCPWGYPHAVASHRVTSVSGSRGGVRRSGS